MNASNSVQTLRVLRTAWIVFGLTGLILSFAVWWFVLASPLISLQSAYDARSGYLTSMISTEHRIRKRLDAVKAESEQLFRSQGTVSQRVPAIPDETGFLDWIGELAHVHGMVLREFRPAGKGTEGLFECRKVRIAAVGTYSGVCQMFNGLRNCPRLSRVNSFEIIPQDVERSEFVMNVEVILYSRPAAVITSKQDSRS